VGHRSYEQAAGVDGVSAGPTEFTPRASPPRALVLGLQETAGNAAVTAWIARAGSQAGVSGARTAVSLQRHTATNFITVASGVRGQFDVQSEPSSRSRPGILEVTLRLAFDFPGDWPPKIRAAYLSNAVNLIETT
jgi:hypothetical protein